MLKRQSNSINNKKRLLSGRSSKDSFKSTKKNSFNSAKITPKSTPKLNFISSKNNLPNLQSLDGNSNLKKNLNRKNSDGSEDSKDDLSYDSNDPQNSFFSNVSRLEPNDSIFIIKDKTTGIEYDMRDPTTLGKLNSNLSEISSKTNDKVVWQDWWKQKKEMNIKLLQAAEIGDLSGVESALNNETLNNQIADVNTKNIENYTALHFASRNGMLDIVEKLIIKGANVNIQTKSLRTPLHIACIQGHLQII